MHRFIFSERYTPGDKSLLLLPFLDQDTPCFSREALPAPLQDVKAPEEAGGKRIALAAPVDNSFLLVLAVRLDAKGMSPAESLKATVSNAVDRARGEKLTTVATLLDHRPELALAAQEGALLGAYVYDAYLGKKPEPIQCQTTIIGSPDSGTEELLQQIKFREMVLNHVNIARDLCNAPPNEIYPQSMAERLHLMAKDYDMDASVWDDEMLEQERCGGILAVGKGSERPPHLVAAHWQAETALFHLALVGKGVTYDSGGYSLKPGESQVGMKYDMAGAATVFAAACAIAKAGLPLKLSVYAPLAQNDISGRAYHVNDIITTRSGKTVEVLNTDAEGRLLLADALTLACEGSPDYVLDVATLTGAAVVGLGEDIAPFYGSDTEFAGLMREASESTGELFWQFPLYPPYGEKLKATVADINNTGKSRLGGSIIAALFLQNWVDEGMKWLHLDIAGPGGKEEPLGPLGKGGKGFGVRTIVELARKLCEKHAS